jgi:hypothetical protein
MYYDPYWVQPLERRPVNLAVAVEADSIERTRGKRNDHALKNDERAAWILLGCS